MANIPRDIRGHVGEEFVGANPRISAALLHARIIPRKFLAYVASDVAWDIRHYESDLSLRKLAKTCDARVGLVMANIPRDIRGHVGEEFVGDDPSMQKYRQNSRIWRFGESGEASRHSR